MTLAAILAIGKRVLFFAIPIPVALILAVWAWVAIDKSSAVRKAVNAAVAELVDGAELAAERARVAGLSWFAGMDWQAVAVIGGLVLVMLLILLLLRRQIVAAVKEIKAEVG